MAFDQVSNDFGVGFSRELVSFLDKLALQLEVILNDSVVSHDDAALAVAVRVSIFFSGTSVGCPSRMAKTKLAGHRFLFEQFFKVPQFAGTSPHGKLVVLDYGNARGVVPSVLKRLESTHDDGYRVSGTDVAEDSTHARLG
jgi:hypothetical protein